MISQCLPILALVALQLSSMGILQVYQSSLFSLSLVPQSEGPLLATAMAMTSINNHTTGNTTEPLPRAGFGHNHLIQSGPNFAPQQQQQPNVLDGKARQERAEATRSAANAQLRVKAMREKQGRINRPKQDINANLGSQVDGNITLEDQNKMEIAQA